ncbi:MAG TPA: class I SAM-dependent methyltransferase [Candidatus Nesterenkonia stercoripullorum]|jgi:predicted O-methyltransferase YrrM|uniref:Class I SAM-dependent methyltransferase n=1 Tax=Candidatus Nesterenkonia stercoripullorum TaxID=2838701 RepID=A0A9D1RZH7_9MICC|nr:class I SAM-dependent methyltransferase [Candidatus Nesterenkonia stercoripullorum]
MSSYNTAQSAKHASWSYAEQHRLDDPVLEAARHSAGELGISAIGTGTAATLTVLAAAVKARTLVEIGTGVGAASVALLRGASADAVLTSIDYDAEHLAAARSTLKAEGIPASRTRLITGRAEDVLQRLTGSAYDLVFIDGDSAHLVQHVEQSLRLLRPGGMLIMEDALDHDAVPRPAVRSESAHVRRTVERMILEDASVFSTLLPTGTGLLTAVKRLG